MAGRSKHFDALGSLREALAERARLREQHARELEVERRKVEREVNAFRDALTGVTPLAPHGRAQHKQARHPPHPQQRVADEKQVLADSVSDEIDVESLLETDEGLSYRANGIGPDVLRRLRRGEWAIQSQVDLHGHRVDEAREALAAFLKQAVKHGRRCVRVVHGKGLGSKGKTPVLKGKVRNWLVQREEVIAFCQARPADGGSGALIVLLRPTLQPGAGRSE